MVLKTPIVSYSPKIAQKARKHHLPNSSTPSVAYNSPTSKQIDYPFRHNPRQLKLIGKKKTFYMAQAINNEGEDGPQTPHPFCT
jgi:hypothetical protein